MKKPQTLKLHDQVAIVSLSAGTLGEAFAAHQRKLGIKRLEDMGLTPRFMPNALRGRDYLNAHPEARAADLKTAMPTLRASFVPSVVMILIALFLTYLTIRHLLTLFKPSLRFLPAFPTPLLTISCFIS